MNEKIELPPRPYIPPAAAGALGSCLACALFANRAWSAYIAGNELDAVLPLLAGVLGGLIWLTAGLFLRAFSSIEMNGRGWQSLAAQAERWFMLGICLGCLGVSSWTRGMNHAAASLDGLAASALSFAIQGDPSVTERGVAVSARASNLESSASARVRLNLDEVIEEGTVLEAIGRIELLDDSEWGRSRFMKGEVASVEVAKVTMVKEPSRSLGIAGVRQLLLSCIDPASSDARALIAGVICGRTTELNRTDASDAFSRTGLTHLVAVSGGHLALIAALLEGGLFRMRARSAVRAAVLGTVMAAYVVFTGCAPSAIRSFLMVAATQLARLGGRRGHTVSALSLTVMCLVALDPGIVYDLGFQLSAASVLFIALFGRYVSYLLQVMHVPRRIAEPLSLTFVAQWATLPLTAPVFGEISLVSPLANLVVGPLMSVLLSCGLILVPLCALLGGFSVILEPAIWLSRASIWCTEVLASLPGASAAVDVGWAQMAVLYLGALVAFVLWRPWSARAMGFALSIMGALVVFRWGYWRYLAPAEIVVLDVGQADCILIRDGPWTFLVDAGVDEEAATALARNHVTHLDGIAITHWDRDHWGGIEHIVESVDVDTLYLAEGAEPAMPEEVRSCWDGPVVELDLNDQLDFGGFICRVVWPRSPVVGEENGDSLCLAVNYQGTSGELSALLTGDSELEQELEYAGEVGSIDLLKVGHHGSKVSVSEELLEKLDPEVAIASAGEGNSYGHPSEECVDAVEAYGALFYCTIDDGDVEVMPDKQGVRVVTHGD